MKVMYRSGPAQVKQGNLLRKKHVCNLLVQGSTFLPQIDVKTCVFHELSEFCVTYSLKWRVSREFELCIFKRLRWRMNQQFRFDLDTAGTAMAF